MIRLILIFVLIFYALHKLGFFRAIGAAFHGEDERRPRDGNVNIDSKPDKKKSDFKGGDYVDYEEVK